MLFSPTLRSHDEKMKNYEKKIEPLLLFLFVSRILFIYRTNIDLSTLRNSLCESLAGNKNLS